jgi:hypothetical protein
MVESSFGLRRRLAPSPPKPRSWREAGGAGFLERAMKARSRRSTTALFALKRQSYLDHLIAHYRHCRSRNDPHPEELAAHNTLDGMELWLMSAADQERLSALARGLSGV